MQLCINFALLFQFLVVLTQLARNWAYKEDFMNPTFWVETRNTLGRKVPSLAMSPNFTAIKKLETGNYGVKSFQLHLL